MNSAVKSLIARLEREFGGNRQFGRSRLFLFGDSFACSINYSKQLRGEKFFYGLAQDVLDPAFSYPQCRFGEHVVLICETVNQCLVLPRALLLEAMAGVKTGKLDVFLEGGRYILQTTGHPKTDITEFLNAFPSAETPTNATQSEPEEHSREHVGVQGALIQLGRAEGLEVWIPQNDRPSEHEGCRFSELTLNRLPRLGIDEVTRKVVENIDVLWLRRNAIQRAFEIESTTRVYSALLRLNDLILSHPNTQISLHIVAPARRRETVRRQVSRPTFWDLAGRCDLITFETIWSAVSRLRFLGGDGSLRVSGLLRSESLREGDSPSVP